MPKAVPDKKEDSPLKQQKAKADHYRLFNRAVSSLYKSDLLTLSSGSVGRVEFDHKVFDRAVREVFAKGGFSPDMLADPAVTPLIEETYKALNKAIDTAIRTETPPELTAALQNNAFIFSGFKTHHSLSEVGLALTDADGKVKPFEVFRRDVEAIDKKYNTNYLYAEYNHAVHTSQMAVKWNDFMADGDRYNLQYRTAGDERVRSEHAALDKITLPPSDEFWKSYLPPNGWNCRCTVAQVLRDDYPMSDPAVAKAAGDACTDDPKARIFRYNAGLEMTVFPKKHPYLPKGCGNCKAKSSIGLVWGRGKGKDACVCCRHLTAQLLSMARKKAIQERKENNPAPVTICDPKLLNAGKLYLGNQDRDNLFGHCKTPHEIVVARNIDRYIPGIRHIRNEEVVPSHFTEKKRKRGVVRYSVYEFDAEVLENGLWISKRVELKCEVRQKSGHSPCEYPYSIRILQE